MAGVCRRECLGCPLGFRSKLFFLLLLVTPSFAAENRVVIGIIDTGLDLASSPQLVPYLCEGLQFEETGTDSFDRVPHGTHIAELIVKDINPKTHCIAMCKWLDVRGGESTFAINACLENLIGAGASYINMSLSGSYSNRHEKSLIRQALAKNIHVVTAAGNEGENLNEFPQYPACYKFDSPYFHVVAATTGGQLDSKSNYGDAVTATAPGYYKGRWGTSFSAARMTNFLVKKEASK